MTDMKRALCKAGIALYGERWQTDLARDLDLADGRRVRQWLTGERPLPKDLSTKLGNLLNNRIQDISDALEQLEMAVNQID